MSPLHLTKAPTRFLSIFCISLVAFSSFNYTEAMSIELSNEPAFYLYMNEEKHLELNNDDAFKKMRRLAILKQMEADYLKAIYCISNLKPLKQGHGVNKALREYTKIKEQAIYAIQLFRDHNEATIFDELGAREGLGREATCASIDALISSRITPRPEAAANAETVGSDAASDHVGNSMESFLGLTRQEAELEAADATAQAANEALASLVARQKAIKNKKEKDGRAMRAKLAAAQAALPLTEEQEQEQQRQAAERQRAADDLRQRCAEVEKELAANDIEAKKQLRILKRQIELDAANKSRAEADTPSAASAAASSSPSRTWEIDRERIESDLETVHGVDAMAIEEAIKDLGLNGYDLSYQQSKPLGGGLFELRPRGNQGSWRIIFAFHLDVECEVFLAHLRARCLHIHRQARSGGGRRGMRSGSGAT